MELILIVATLLGGGSAIWFFWEKLSPIFHARKVNNANVSNTVLSLPDEEFLMLERIMKFPFSNAYSPTSENEVNLCKSLENRGWLKSSGKSAYKLTTKAKPLNA